MIKESLAGMTLGFCLFFSLSGGIPMVVPLHEADWVDDIERDKQEIMGPISWTKPKEETTNENHIRADPMGERQQDIDRNGYGACLPSGQCIFVRCHDCEGLSCR